MKFSLWLEGRKRNQASDTKMPRIMTSKELQLRTANSRIHDMVGQGSSKTHGRAGTHDAKKPSRSQENRDAIRDSH